MILLAHSFFLRRDAKQLERFKPYPPLTTLLAAAMLREAGHEASLFDATFAHNGGARPWTDQPVGTPEQVAEIMRPYLGIGFRHFTFGFPAPYDAESMVRLATEVRPLVTG